MTAVGEPCDCYAYDAGWIEHSKAQHTSCGDTYTMGAACGGCSDCLSAQASYWDYRRSREEARDDRS
ncbi:MAG TPA: hypothetical protein VM820_01480 [Vicinamibacterales bacterium]|jgi:hypothetical protein|nr:hypothetical protein [Vicinamibacterales bacterium]